MNQNKQENKTISLSDYIQQTKGEMISIALKKRKDDQWKPNNDVL